MWYNCILKVIRTNLSLITELVFTIYHNNITVHIKSLYHTYYTTSRNTTKSKCITKTKCNFYLLFDCAIPYFEVRIYRWCNIYIKYFLECLKELTINGNLLESEFLHITIPVFLTESECISLLNLSLLITRIHNILSESSWKVVKTTILSHILVPTISVWFEYI